MKGFKDKNKKFHPITETKGVRKSRDQSMKTQGVKIRKKRTVNLRKLPNVVSRSDNHSFEIDDGQIHFRLDDFGWYWSGDEEQINGFMARMVRTEIWSGFVKDLEDAGVTVDMLKPILLKSITGKLAALVGTVVFFQDFLFFPVLAPLFQIRACSSARSASRTASSTRSRCTTTSAPSTVTSVPSPASIVRPSTPPPCLSPRTDPGMR